MDLEKAEVEKTRNAELESFIENLKGQEDITGLNFLHNLNQYVKNNDVDFATAKMIEGIVNANT